MTRRIDASRLNRRWNCRLTTIGRRSGKPRTVTIWFVAADDRVFLTGSAEEPHWCRNIRADGRVELRIGSTSFTGRARVVDDPEEGRAIVDRFPRKYWLARVSRLFGGYTRSVPVAVEIEA